MPMVVSNVPFKLVTNVVAGPFSLLRLALQGVDLRRVLLAKLLHLLLAALAFAFFVHITIVRVALIRVTIAHVEHLFETLGVRVDFVQSVATVLALLLAAFSYLGTKLLLHLFEALILRALLAEHGLL